jgi:hypothetical protein
MLGARGDPLQHTTGVRPGHALVRLDVARVHAPLARGAIDGCPSMTNDEQDLHEKIH